MQERGALRVGLVAKDIPPLLVTGSDGQPAGIEVAVASGLARRLGVELQFVRTAATHDELVAQVATGEVDVAVSSITRTVERAKVVRFSRPYLTQSVAVALNRVRALQENVACPDTAADAVARSGGLGVTRGGAYEQALRTRTKASIRWSSTPKRNSTRPWKPPGCSPVWAARSNCASCSPGTRRRVSSSSFA
ncbi:MAG: transporter substrate-binding domain-containing protein, partial [Bradyrhizobium sp.]